MRTLLVLAASASLLAAAPAPGAAQVLHGAVSSDAVPRRTVSVEGEAELRVAPDEVVIALGVETYGTVLQRAKEENDARVTAVLAAVRRNGVPTERIKTDYLGIEPRYVCCNDERTVAGYVVRRSIVVTLREIPAFERLIEDAVAAGVTHVHGTDFRTTELRAHRDRARALALDAAREKAAAMAERLGQRLGAPVSVSEGSAGWWSFSQGWGSRWSGGASQNVVQNAGGAAESSGPMSPGQITVTGRVSVTFELVP
jgi:uncharacterized protein YggE